MLMSFCLEAVDAEESITQATPLRVLKSAHVQTKVPGELALAACQLVQPPPASKPMPIPNRTLSVPYQSLQLCFGFCPCVHYPTAKIRSLPPSHLLHPHVYGGLIRRFTPASLRKQHPCCTHVLHLDMSRLPAHIPECLPTRIPTAFSHRVLYSMHHHTCKRYHSCRQLGRLRVHHRPEGPGMLASIPLINAISRLRNPLHRLGQLSFPPTPFPTWLVRVYDHHRVHVTIVMRHVRVQLSILCLSPVELSRNLHKHSVACDVCTFLGHRPFPLLFALLPPCFVWSV